MPTATSSAPPLSLSSAPPRPRPEVSVVVPVYNEGENIATLLRAIEQHVPSSYEVLICYDFDEDTTLPAVAAMAPPPLPGRLRLVKNTFGRGVVNAVRAGFAASEAWLGVVVTMADLSDPPDRITALVSELRKGADVVAGSRYMRGGKQVGGPFLKRTLSRLAGLGAYYLSSINSHDVTTNFRAYSRRLVASTPIESKGGWEVGLELTAKAHRRGWRVAEVPSAWYDRTAGASRFRLFAWLPSYLRWYGLLLWADWTGAARRGRRHGPHPADYGYFLAHDTPGYGWTVRRPLPGCVIVPVTADGRYVLVRTRRPFHGSDESHWEFPGGAVEENEDPRAAAARELAEETGYVSDDPGRVLPFLLESIPNMGSYPHYCVVIGNCRGGAPTADQEGEGIDDVAAFSEEEVSAMVKDGRIRAMPTAAAWAAL